MRGAMTYQEMLIDLFCFEKKKKISKSHARQQERSPSPTGYFTCKEVTCDYGFFAKCAIEKRQSHLGLATLVTTKAPEAKQLG